MIRRVLKSIPPVDALGRSIKWFGRVYQCWRSDSRQFLLYPPGHYYSPLPNPNDYRDRNLFEAKTDDLPGLSLNREEQVRLVREIAPYVSDHPYAEHPTPGSRYYFENLYFPYSDALFLCGIMRHVRPRRVIEVGSGFSSAAMLDVARAYFPGQVSLTFIDPDPVRLNALLDATDRTSCRVLESRVQDVPAVEFEALAENDILFVDSSHVSKIGSDVNYLLFDVFPRLKPGVLIHVHDLFWPFEYPRHWVESGIAWNEAYLIRALLTGGTRYRILAFPSYLERFEHDLLAAEVPLTLKRSAANPTVGGASLWLTVVGDRT